MATGSKICETPYCRNKKRRSKNKAGQFVYGKECDKCRMRKYRAANPCRNYYQHLKWSAKKRGIPFTLTFEHLEQVTGRVKGFFKKTGLLGTSLTIDRIKGELGYEDGNIQVKSRSNNSKKYWAKDRHYNFGDEDHSDPDYAKDLPF